VGSRGKNGQAPAGAKDRSFGEALGLMLKVNQEAGILAAELSFGDEVIPRAWCPP